MQTYQGGCHCGAVRYEVEMELGDVVSCNCSMCSRKGYLLSFVPSDKFKLVSGEGAQTDYQFNKKSVHHLFCATCGVTSFGTGIAPDGSHVHAINVRCLDGLDLGALNVVPVDGRSI